MIQGKTISITGTIQLRDGKPEIEIVSADQISVVRVFLPQMLFAKLGSLSLPILGS